MAKNTAITAEQVRAILHYDPETGIFRWHARSGAARYTRTFNSRFAGKVARSVDSHGHLRINIGGVFYAAHRLAWVYMTGKWPGDQIDHIDMDRENNRWVNLREATNAQNNSNRRVQSNNKIGLKGVSICSTTKKYRATITADGKQRTLGRFDCPAAAHFAYVVAADQLHGEFARAS